MSEKDHTVRRGDSPETAKYKMKADMRAKGHDLGRSEKHYDTHEYYHNPAPKAPSQHGPYSGFLPRPVRHLFAGKAKSETTDAYTPATKGYTPRLTPSHTVSTESDAYETGGGYEKSSGGTALGAAAAGGAATGVGIAALLGGSLLPALLVTAGVAGVVVSYQYFTKTGLFREPAPMQRVPGSALASGATPSEQLQAMINSENSRLKAGQAQLAAAGPMEIEVPRTPSPSDPNKPLPAMMPPKGGSKGLA